MKKNKGFSLVELMVAMSVSGIALGVIGTQFAQTVKQGKERREKLAGPLIEITARNVMTSAHLIRDAILLQGGADLESCFKGSGTNCHRYRPSAPQPFSTSDIMLRDRYMGGEKICNQLEENCPIYVQVRHNLRCSTVRKCEGVEITTDLTYYDVKTRKAGKSKAYSVYFDGSDLFEINNFSTSSCENSLVGAINLTSGAVECAREVPPVDCDGFSVMGIGSDDCGEAPEMGGSQVCTLSFGTTTAYISDGSFNGANLSWGVQGSDLVRFGVQCTANRAEGRVRDLLYFSQANNQSGDITVLSPDYNSGTIEVNCMGAGMDESGRQVASCSASFRLEQNRPPPRDPADSGSGASGGSGWGTGSDPGGSSASSGGSTSANAGGTGGDINTDISN